MKIAFVGKGGSGKSSVSWLAVKTLEDMGISTLAIDADHNMDLTSNLGLDPEKTPLMHKTEREFMEAVGLGENDRLVTLTTKEGSLPEFSFNPKDSYTASITTSISKTVDLINIGLGSPDVLYTTKCAHALSGPLKFYLGLLNAKDDVVIIDSVAGTDMMNYGLYAGIDAVIGVVEPHRNSVKVFEQIADLCRKVDIPFFGVINKPTDNEFYQGVKEKYGKKIIGEIPFDSAIMEYNFTKLSTETKGAMKAVMEKLQALPKRNGLSSIYKFQHSIKENI